MVFGTLSDPLLLAAFWAAVVATALVVLVSGLIVALRVGQRRHEAAWQRFVQQWRPMLLAHVTAGDTTAALPPLPWRDRQHFLRLWLYLHESLRGEAADRLNEAALALQVPRLARRMLAHGSGTSRLLAVLALGRLKHQPAWDQLRATARQRDPLLSVQAARALAQIDPLRAAQLLMPLVLSRPDWDIARVAEFLGGARQAYWLLLLKRLPELKPRQVQRGLRLAHALRLQLPGTALQELLAPWQPPAVLCAALAVAGRDAGSVAHLVPLLEHPAAAVREQAVLALAPLAGQADVPRLARRLADDSFDVRMAAARALAALPAVAPEHLRRWAAQLPAAQPVVTQVLAELEAP